MSEKELVKEIIEKFKERIEAAELLLKDKKFEDSVSRSYYALFDAVRGLLELEKITAKSHRGAITKFHQHFIKTGIFDIKTSKTIARLIKLREEADYTFQTEISKAEAETAFKDTKKFLMAVENYLNKNYLNK
ncbi:HEPN domain-containing protein [Patescibacteria group bacterium]|nr:HEPN domain-containing protein [Patescibacteria group bacterium]